VGGVLDVAGDTIRVYLDGAQDASTAVTFGAAAFSPGTPTLADGLGGRGSPPASTALQLDGLLAEVALWADDLTTTGFGLLAKGYSPLFVLPQSLVAYWPLLGAFAPEIDVTGTATGTVTGSLPRDLHPAVLYPAPPLILDTPTAVASSVLFRKTLSPLGTHTGGRQRTRG
jgi:hypothetical protein